MTKEEFLKSQGFETDGYHGQWLKYETNGEVCWMTVINEEQGLILQRMLSVSEEVAGVDEYEVETTFRGKLPDEIDEIKALFEAYHI